MNNLIINEIDYSIFDLEWAKRGGVVYHYGDFCRYICDGENYNEIRAGQDGEFLIGEEKTVGLVSILTTEKVENSPYYLRMATPDECAEAGVDYMEPTMVWRDIESAPRDVLVLVKTDKSKVGCAIFESKTECEYFGLNPIDGTFIHWMPLPHPPKTQ